MKTRDKLDRVRFEKVAKQLKQRLSGSFGTILSIANRDAEVSATDGVCVALAKIKECPIKLELWLDRFTNRNSDCRYFYGGFHSRNKASIVDIAKNAPFDIRNSRVVECDDLQKYNKGSVCLKTGLSKDESRYPVREFYSDGSFYLGLYCLVSDEHDNSTSERIYSFFDAVLSSLFTNRIANAVLEDINAVEGGLDKRSRAFRKRAIQAAKKFVLEKQKQGLLVCEGAQCGFDPRVIIGDQPIQPRSLLDVHHKNPLYKGPRVTEYSGLVLLCPNCHRLEHAKLRLKEKLVSKN